MNYIKSLQAENKRLEHIIKDHGEIVAELRDYLLSSKFRCGDELDGYVNIQDVLNRIVDIQ